ncbi:mammalian cell entry protein [Sphingomonas sp. Leaf33]|uniref:MlaD family protein n=1 Tax=Sphingomonas sp. Leaf33 TaxID=1736215 RepID=UPI0006F4E9EF|nr:MlaD family protein [Sphingomonas sp. Leaf33]KQN25523.1 mammalian cell entry protein [Sphingomonas sp. Leaf33]
METRSNHVLVGGVVLILLLVLALFTVWLSRMGVAEDKEYDILFKQAVDGLARGSVVNYSGVPVGQVKDIALYPPDPQLVRVRVTVKPETPVLQGATAAVVGSFTGTSTVQIDGAQRGAPPIVCPDTDPQRVCPFGVPLIPPRAGGLGALLSSAPQLLERLTTLTERLSGLLSDRNQASIAGILANTNRLTDALADRGPEIAATLAQTRIAIQQAGNAAQQIGDLAETANGVVAQDVKPAMANLNKAIGSAQKSMDSLNDVITDAKPAVQGFSRNTLPEVNQLVHDLRVMAASLSSVAEKVDQRGAGALIGSSKLPDYEPKK